MSRYRGCGIYFLIILADVVCSGDNRIRKGIYHHINCGCYGSSASESGCTAVSVGPGGVHGLAVTCPGSCQGCPCAERRHRPVPAVRWSGRSRGSCRSSSCACNTYCPACADRGTAYCPCNVSSRIDRYVSSGGDRCSASECCRTAVAVYSWCCYCLCNCGSGAGTCGPCSECRTGGSVPAVCRSRRCRSSC